MQLQQPFDATQFDPSQGIPSLPVGKHPVVISASEIKATTAGDSGMLELELSIIDGPAKGQKGAYRLNLYNKSEKAVEIAHRQFSAICHVTGVYRVTDSQQLHNIPFVVEVALQKDPEAAAKGYTEVKRVFDMRGNEPGKQGQAAAAAQVQQPNQAPASGQPTWGQPQAQQPTAAPASGQPTWGQPQGGQPGNAAPVNTAAPVGNTGGWGAPASGVPANNAVGRAPPWSQNRP